jgi:hypothetical protein
VRLAATIALLASGPFAGRASACAACFGKTDAPLAQGMNAGIFVMLGFVVVAWIAFGSFFVFIARRARLSDSSAADSAAPNIEPTPSSPASRNQ